MSYKNLEICIRELIINMVVHRDYQSAGDSFVKIYDDHIEFFNPGPLPNELTVEQLLSGKYVSYARNRKIADMFREAGLIEKYGDGIKRVTGTFQENGLKLPFFENFQHGFRVVAFSPESEKDIEKDIEKLTMRQREIISLIKASPRISAEELSAKVGINKRNVLLNIRKLKDAGIIQRIGPDKGGHWEIVDKQKVAKDERK
jgi:ATP-dependent DNA helicase RecG